MNRKTPEDRRLRDAIQAGHSLAPAIKPIFQTMEWTLDALSYEFAPIAEACPSMRTVPLEKCDFSLRGTNQNVIIP